MANGNRDWKVIVEGLLRKAEDSAVTDEERESLMDKVAYLMAKYGIEEAQLNAKFNTRENVTFLTFTIKNPQEIKKNILLNGLAITFGCYAIKKGNTVEVHGFTEDLEKVQVLYNSLLVQMFVSLVGAQSQKPDYEHGKTFNSSFLSTFVSVVLNRVRSAYARAKQDAAKSGNGAELVLRDRKEAVVARVLQLYPKIGKNGYRTPINSSAGSRAGRDAGQRADIGQSRLGSTGKSITT